MAFHQLTLFAQDPQSGAIATEGQNALVNTSQILMIVDLPPAAGLGIKGLTTVTGVTLFTKTDANFHKAFPGYAELSKLVALNGTKV